MSERTYRCPHEMANTISTASKLPAHESERLLSVVSSYYRDHVQYVRAFNGKGSEVLLDKFFFVELATHLGFSPPTQWIGQNFIPQEHVDDETPYVVKPYKGSNGVGLRIFDDPFEVSNYVATSDRRQIVQNRVPLEGEVRYVSYKKPNEDSVMRIALHRHMPTLYGNGRDPLLKLIMQQDAPLYYKAAVVGRKKTELLKVPQKGEVIPLATGGNWKLGAYETLLQDAQMLSHIDTYVDTLCRGFEQLLNAAPEALDVNLRHVALDLGIRNWEVGSKQSPEDAIMASMCPFEFHFPYSIGGYYLNMPGSLMQKAQMLKTLQLYTHLELVQKS